MLDKKTVLKQYFGHSEFRNGQEAVVDAILSGRDALCVMPTGAGKSVCYQVPALALGGVTVVVSPLISLMKDQVSALLQNGIRAAYLNSSLTHPQYEKALLNFKRGEYQILYVAPERLTVPEFLEACRGARVNLVAVDEAHCISQWGQDFRPSYLKIADFVEALQSRPVVAAFTATATSEVKDDIEYSLRLRDPFRITTGFDRPNLKFEVLRPMHGKMNVLLELLRKHEGESGIVYCATRKNVEEVGECLCEEGFPAAIYHAGLKDEVRRQSQEDFVYDRKRIMVATNAFGMGIDKSNVSFVIHYNMPMDVESYYQEAGRAGRDGSSAECILLYSPGDVHTNQYLIEHSEPNPELSPEEQRMQLAREYERLKLMVFYSTTNACLRHFMLDYFGERSADYCGNCSNCLQEFQEVDVTVEVQKVLSCVKRTGQRFGGQMISNILRGSENERILRLGLDNQTTYGSMREWKAWRLRSLISFLLLEGYLEEKGTEYPTLALGEKANGVLYEGERVRMKQAKPKERPLKRTKKEKRAENVDRGPLIALKALRRKLADERGVPAYIIFSDATLVDMCRVCPKTLSEMLTVSGVGRVKLEQYGEAFLQVLASYS
jgi:ATP-dependent DNA helicase RecQ